MSNNSQTENAVLEPSTGTIEDCLKYLNHALTFKNAMKILYLKLPKNIFIVYPQIKYSWNEIDKILTCLPKAPEKLATDEVNIKNLILDRKEGFSLFEEELGQKIFSPYYELNRGEESALRNQFLFLEETLTSIKCYLLNLKGSTLWYRTNLFRFCVLAFLIWYLVGIGKESWIRNHRGYNIIRSRQEWGNLEVDRSVTRKNLKIDKHSCITGLGTHANSEIIIKTWPGLTRLSGICGLDNGFELAGTIKCNIFQNSQLLFKTGVLNVDNRSMPFNIPVKPDTEITLVITNAGNGNTLDHSDWCDLIAR